MWARQKKFQLRGRLVALCDLAKAGRPLGYGLPGDARKNVAAGTPLDCQLPAPHRIGRKYRSRQDAAKPERAKKDNGKAAEARGPELHRVSHFHRDSSKQPARCCAQTPHLRRSGSAVLERALPPRCSVRTWPTRPHLSRCHSPDIEKSECRYTPLGRSGTRQFAGGELKRGVPRRRQWRRDRWAH